MTESYRIGVIGGSGLYSMAGLEIHQERVVATPFGEPSAPFVLGELDGRRVVFLPRHGRHHQLMPTELNFRANILAMKQLGVEWLLSVSAVGSMKEQYAPTHVLVPDQFYDRTRHRADTFFGAGLVAHVSMADPVCSTLADIFYRAALAAGATAHQGGTYLCMEGPQFSTRAESNIYRSWGVDVIGMTNLQEAKLAREAEISYATLAMITDYDCWHDDHDDVSVEAVMAVLRRNAEMGQAVVRHAIGLIPEGSNDTAAANALRYALITDRDSIPADTLRKLAPIVGKYLPVPE